MVRLGAVLHGRIYPGDKGARQFIRHRLFTSVDSVASFQPQCRNAFSIRHKGLVKIKVCRSIGIHPDTSKVFRSHLRTQTGIKSRYAVILITGRQDAAEIEIIRIEGTRFLLALHQAQTVASEFMCKEIDAIQGVVAVYIA